MGIIDRTGERKKMNCGMYAKIIAYRSATDIDIQWEDKSKEYNRQYREFKSGEILNHSIHIRKYEEANKRINEKRKMNCGMYATIIAYRSSQDIDIQFEDGFITYNKRYSSFVKGEIGHYDKKSKKATRRLNERRKMNCGMYATIIAYRSSQDTDIQFEDGYIVYKRAYAEFYKGTILNPNISRSHNRVKRLNERRLMNCGIWATIINYRASNCIDVKLDDGTIIENRSYSDFSNGLIRHPNLHSHCTGIINSITIIGKVNKSSIIYKCKCNNCNKEMLLTMTMILKHKCKQEIN